MNPTTERTAEADEQRFRRLFSQQLAEALRAKDEEEAAERERLRGGGGGRRAARPADDAREREGIRRAYAELCHDDPIVSGGDGDCRRLARALTPKFKSFKSSGKGADSEKLGLSPRLVQGILQATARAGTNSTHAPSSQKEEGANAEQESLFGPGITTAGGYAEVAFATFVEGPYRCIQQADDLPVASKFLGSFEPPETPHVAKEKLSAEEKSRLVDEATAKIVEGMEKMGTEGDVETQGAAGKAAANAHDDASSSSSEFFHRNASHGAQPQDSHSLEEVFAEESDPDDFDYGSSYDYPDSGEEAEKADSYVYDDLQDAVFDPLELSVPAASNQTWEGSRKAMYCLLSSASYGKLALGSLSSRAWSDGAMSETLADLSFILLLEVAKREQGDAGDPNSLLHSSQEDNQSDAEDITSLWDRPLILLRDRALDKRHGHDALPAYLQLLTAFMSHADSEPDVMSLLTSPHGISTATAENMMPPITTVGLSSLASICSSKDMTSSAAGQMCGTSTWSVCPREEIRKAILSSTHSLARIVECVRPRKEGIAAADESAPQNSAWARTAACIIPIIEYLTNLQGRLDFDPLFEGGASHINSSLSAADAKAILDTGLFRELLSMFTATSTAGSSSAVSAVRMQLLRTIFSLAVLSPELLGRYAVRVPDLAKEVHASDFIEEHLVDGILWTSLGSSLLESKSDTPKPRLKLRANSKLQTTIETKTLAERSIAGLAAMLDSSKTALESLKQCMQEAEERALSEEEQTKYQGCKAALGDVKRFSNCLSNCPSATAMWLDSLINHPDSTQKALTGISELKSILATLPFIPEEAKAPQRGHKKDDDDDSVKSPDDDLAEAGKVLTSNQLRKDYGAIVASTRASVKVIALALETRKGNGLPLRGHGPCAVSSKTD
ncbi:hypothetical protein ACHAXT_006656 [Thalassiosira profunda]